MLRSNNRLNEKCRQGLLPHSLNTQRMTVAIIKPYLWT